ncbi:MAG: AAA family ATPase [Gemmatimonadetes bacterium]|nr:AAA family ATPase [Gemmatimonadota bacterium]
MGESGGGLTKAAGNPARPSRLSRLTLEGYKSFRNETVDFGDVTVLLGANGAGKSNLLSFFGMLGFLSTGALQEFIGRAGHSDSILFGGRKTTPQLRAAVEFVGEDPAGGERRTTYRMRLGDAAPDTLIFLDERAVYSRSGFAQPEDIQLGIGHLERSGAPWVYREIWGCRIAAEGDGPTAEGLRGYRGTRRPGIGRPRRRDHPREVAKAALAHTACNPIKAVSAHRPAGATASVNGRLGALSDGGGTGLRHLIGGCRSL